MVAAVSTTVNPKAATRANLTRPPLLPSDPDNAPAPRRPKPREVTSRYLTSSTSSTSSSSSSSSFTPRRCASPVISRTPGPMTMATPAPAVPSAVKRSQSAERRRPVTPRTNSVDLRGAKGGELSSAQKMLLTSARSSHLSFQGDSFSRRASKEKPAPTPAPSRPISRRGTPERKATPERKGTPERRKPVVAPTLTYRKDQLDNSKTLEQQRWPARLRSLNSLSQSVDWTDDRKKLGGSATGGVVRSLQSSLMHDARSSSGARLSGLDSSKPSLRKESDAKSESNLDIELDGTGNCIASASDTESVSSLGGDGGNGVQGQRGPRGIVVPARFWQETNNRIRRLAEPGSPRSKAPPGLRTPTATPKLTTSKKLGFESPVSSPKGTVNTRGQSPIRGAVRPSSPSKLGSMVAASPRGLSPSRVRNGMSDALLDRNASNTPSVSSFVAEIRRGKIGESKFVDAHALRLLHSRLLQWRFVNAGADASTCAQKLNAERSLYNAWARTSKLRESVRSKRIELQLQRESMKLAAIVNGQMSSLEEWALIERDYSSSLTGATEALTASTLRLPIAGAKADVQKMKNAICSAVDVLQGMAASICLLSSKVGDVNGSVIELANVVAQERGLLDQCRDLLSTAEAMQVKEQSQRTHILQLSRETRNPTAKPQVSSHSVPSLE